MTEHAFLRPQAKILASRLEEPRRFIQTIAGPRQVGKTTLVRQVLRGVTDSNHYASADEPTLRGPGWIELQWEVARTLASDHSQGGSVLVLDEIQKLQEWPETVKRLWDEDSATGRNVKVVLLGSSPLLVQRGLGESLAGRFELLYLPHWSYPEMRAAFGWSLEQFLYFGGYPGAAPLALEPERWARYIINSLVETTISRDLFLLKRVDKPALFRRLFYLGCSYSGQVLSYNKMLGQLQEAGNTTTLAHYLDLLSGAGMVAGLPKYASGAVRQRGSSPKLLVYNTALLTSQSGLSTEEARADPVFWGHLVESAIGAYLVNAAAAGSCEVFYWRERNREVDFIVRRSRQLIAIEVKSGRVRDALSGMEAFSSAFHPQRKLLVGSGGIEVEAFLSHPIDYWLTSPISGTLFNC